MAAPPATAATAGADRRRTAADWLRTHRAIVILLLVPLAVFGVAQAFGWVFLDGDNFLQNFPMRVLVGPDLGHGVAAAVESVPVQRDTAARAASTPAPPTRRPG